MTELPFETWERIMHEPWPGGTSDRIVKLLNAYGIIYEPGSEEANLQLQDCLIHERVQDE